MTLLAPTSASGAPTASTASTASPATAAGFGVVMIDANAALAAATSTAMTPSTPTTTSTAVAQAVGPWVELAAVQGSGSLATQPPAEPAANDLAGDPLGISGAASLSGGPISARPAVTKAATTDAVTTDAVRTDAVTTDIAVIDPGVSVAVPVPVPVPVPPLRSVAAVVGAPASEAPSVEVAPSSAAAQSVGAARSLAATDAGITQTNAVAVSLAPTLPGDTAQPVVRTRSLAKPVPSNPARTASNMGGAPTLAISESVNAAAGSVPAITALPVALPVTGIPAFENSAGALSLGMVEPTTTAPAGVASVGVTPPASAPTGTAGPVPTAVASGTDASSGIAPLPIAAPQPYTVEPLAATTTAAASQSSPFAAQFVRPIFTLVAAGPGAHLMTINVTPDNLGPVTVRAHLGPDGIRVELFAPTDVARDAIRAILPDLRKDLSGGGVSANLDLSSQDRPNDRSDFDPPRQRIIELPATPDPDATVAPLFPPLRELNPSSIDVMA